MRKPIDMQMSFGEIPIDKIKFDLKSRDEIPKVLIGLQKLYCNLEIRGKIFQALMDLIPKNVNPNNGRTGMDLWKILVLGVLRLNCNFDHDKLHEIANNHGTLRLMLGHGLLNNEYRYALQTLKDNISLFTPEILDKINQIVVGYGHKLIGRKAGEGLRASCDSFVLETNVHYPTDINILFDALRKMIVLIMRLCGQLGLSEWRQGVHHLKKAKRAFRKSQTVFRSTSNNPQKKAEREKLIIEAHLAYIALAQSLVDRVKESIAFVAPLDIMVQLKIDIIAKYLVDAERQIDQIRRRVFEGESIPHHEKVFSLFEEHTEWISKGKAGISQELGLKVCIVKDQFGFILHHRVMEKETDDKVAVSIINETKERFDKLISCSFDKGLHSQDNQRELSQILDRVILPRKGKLSAINKEIENSEEFKEARRKHSAVESSINALENHGLDRCLDHGLNGFKRYVALAVLARNIQIIGHIQQQKELKRQQVLEKRLHKKAA